MPKLKQYDTIVAEYRPARTRHLRFALVGTFMAAWVIEDGPMEGQWAMQAAPPFPLAWVPACDLKRIGEG